MKYNKEKTKKFQKGGKTPKEVMEEARRNQAIWRQQQEENISSAIARDAANTAAIEAVNNSGIPAYQSQQVAINAPRPTVELTAPDITQRSDLKSMFKTRGEAFNYARKQGWNDFTWGGESFHTRTAEEVSGAATSQTTPSDNVQDLVTETPTESLTGNSVIFNPPWVTYGQFPRTAPRSTSTTTSTSTSTPPVTNTSVRTTRGPQPGSTPEQRRANRQAIWGPLINTWRTNRERNRNRETSRTADIQYMGTRSIMQQGGKIEDKPLYLRNVWERMFGITPGYTPVNSQESITSYMDNTLKGPVEKRVIRKEVPYAKLHSTMSIRNPGTNRADTTFTAPSGTTYNMNDVRSGKAPSGYSYKFFKNPAGYFQQGGTIDQEESGSTDQLYVDFAIRYLKAKGVSEDDMVDNEGGLKDEFLEEISTAISEVDSPEFWEQYKSNPDATIQSYIESKMEPEQIEMARKGAKLKKLKKGGMKSRKCKCGCSMKLHEEGGKITETCPCCGNKITKHEGGGLFNRIYNPKENNPKNFKDTSIFSEVKGQKNPTFHSMNRDGKFIHPTPIISETIQDGDTIYRTGGNWLSPPPRLGRANTTEGARSNSPYREDYERAKKYFYDLYNNSEAMDIIQEGYEVRRIRDLLRNKYDFKRIYRQ